MKENNTDFKSTVLSESVFKTEKIASAIGHNLRGGEVIILKGDLGSGKTAFVRGLVRGSGSLDFVSSPSFVIRNDYQTARNIIAHFDFYRLDDPGILSSSLQELLGDNHYIIVIEWGDIVSDLLPRKTMIIEFSSLSSNKRKLDLTYDKALSYLVGGLN